MDNYCLLMMILTTMTTTMMMKIRKISLTTFKIFIFFNIYLFLAGGVFFLFVEMFKIKYFIGFVLSWCLYMFTL